MTSHTRSLLVQRLEFYMLVMVCICVCIYVSRVNGCWVHGSYFNVNTIYKTLKVLSWWRIFTKIHVSLSCKLFEYWSHLMTFKRDVTTVWSTGLDSLVFTEVSDFKCVLRVNYRKLLRTFYMLSILLPANISKKSFCCN